LKITFDYRESRAKQPTTFTVFARRRLALSGMPENASERQLHVMESRSVGLDRATTDFREQGNAHLQAAACGKPDRQ
jgi:hypothetical protein